MNIKNLIIPAMIGLIITSCGKKGGSGMSLIQGDSAPQEYQTEIVQTGSADLELIYPATVKGAEDIEIRPRVDGFIKSISVDEGSVVRKGQVLFIIDSPQTEQAVRTAEATVNSAKANVNTAKLNVDRIRPLAEKNIVSQVQLSIAENSYETALAGLAQAQAALDNANASRSWATVTSPVNGLVGTIGYRQGSLVNQSNILTTIANISNVYANFSLNEKELMAFMNDLPGTTQEQKIGNIPSVALILADGTEYAEKGRIETISGVVSSVTGSVNFRAEFPNREGILRSGTSGKVVIPRKLENVFVIPQNATFKQLNKTLVYRVQSDSVVAIVIDVASLPDGKRYAVTGGLNAGDRIVTDGIASLSDGKKIIVK